jgi:hypothetical protein
MTGEREARSPVVPETASQGEETEQQRVERWSFVEPANWTERMIAALATGVTRGKWPNAFFNALGLFTMTAARRAAGYSR